MQRKTSLDDLISFLYDKYNIRKNIILHDFEYKEKGADVFKELNIPDLWIDCHRNNHTGASPDKIKNIIRSSLTEDHNPLLAYLEGLPKWNGTDYFEELARYLNINETDDYRFVYHFKKWFVRLVRCMIDDKYFNKQMIVFVQEEQNGGKTTFCRWLCPDELNTYYTETITNGKDEDIQLASNFMICYDELNKLNRSSIDNIKSLMSRLNVNVRLPYEARQQVLNRRCSFVGNTNKIEFLNDETGSIRFICFELLDKIDFDYSKNIKVDHLYAQAYYLLQSGEFVYEISNQDCKMIQEHNKRFFILTPEISLLQQHYRPPALWEEQKPFPAGFRYVTATQILEELQKLTHIKLNIYNIGKSLKFLNYKRISKRIGNKYNPLYCYAVIQLNKANEKKIKEKKNLSADENDVEVYNELNFGNVWYLYGKKGNKKISEQKWERITNDCKQKALIHIPLYVKSTPDLQYRKNFETYISQEHWENPIITNPQKIPNNEHGRLEAAFNAKGTYDSTI